MLAFAYTNDRCSPLRTTRVLAGAHVAVGEGEDTRDRTAAHHIAARRRPDANIGGINVSGKQIIALVAASLALVACGGSSAGEPAESVPVEGAEQEDAGQALAGVDLDEIKRYALANAVQMKAGTEELAAAADAYYVLVEAHGFDYDAAWEAEGEALAGLVEDARRAWVDASLYYELDEGVVAGVPELADYDTWIDAGPPASETPDEAFEWTLELPDGRSLESPGNLFHSLLEPALYGTNPEFVGAEVDFDGDGEVVFTEVLPEANILKGSADALDGATAEMTAAIEAWEPNLDDTFTALVVMTPTMNEYFEQWKLSAFVAGEDYEEEAFVGLSRLFDITNILNGLNLAYDTVSPLVVEADPDLDAQIQSGYDDLTGYVDELYAREQSGAAFSAEEADLLGTGAQDKAEALSALVAQAASELDVGLALE